MRKLLLGLAACAMFSAAAENGVKYHPGHYVAVEGSETLRKLKCLDEPAIRGVNIRYRWAELEPQKDQYDFSAVREDLAYLAARGKQLVLFFTDKTFSPKSPNPLPEYMRPHGVVNQEGGVSPKKWDAYLIEREIALCRALAKEFDTHPNFEGLAYQESAPSLSREGLKAAGYNAEVYRDSLKRMLIGSSQAFPRSQIFWYQNFFPGKDEYRYEIAEALVPYRVVMGGPDILPYRKALITSNRIYDEFRGKLKLFCSAQYDSYSHHKDDVSNGTKRPFKRGEKPIHPEGYVPMEQIFLYGRDQMHLNYIFWSYVTSRPKPYPGDPPAFVFDDALKVIRKYPAFN